MGLLHSFRWFGARDPVDLLSIKQAGARGIVTALHDVPTGEIWETAHIKATQEYVTRNGLAWVVVESLNVHEDIKAGRPGRDRLIDNYIQSLANLASLGLYTVCYNFMPLLDWTRTELEHIMPDGSLALRFDEAQLALFDLFLLQRENAAASYDSNVVEAALALKNRYNDQNLHALGRTIMAGVPGSGETYELSTFKELLSSYLGVTRKAMQENLSYFLNAVVPAAHELGVNLCIHPDDPPFEILGIPRIMSTEKDIGYLIGCDVRLANGLTFCSGSLGANPENDLPALIEKFGPRIHFLHLRSIYRERTGKSFFEDDHLGGSSDMYLIMKAVLAELTRRRLNGEQAELPMRPDHGHKLASEPYPDLFPGYSFLGRLKGLSELRGLELGIAKSLFPD